MKQRWIALLTLMFALPLAAKVYWPGTGRGVTEDGLPRRSFAEESNARLQMSEPVVFNGVSAELQVFRVPRPLAQLLEDLRRRFPALTVRESIGGTVLQWQAQKGWRERILLVAVPNSDVVTAFAIRLPDPMPPKPRWPETMPEIAGATLRELMEFSRKQSTVLNFSGAAGREIALHQAESWLISRGFAPVTGEAVAPGGSGEIYRNARTGELFLISVTADGSGTMMRSRKQ